MIFITIKNLKQNFLFDITKYEHNDKFTAPVMTARDTFNTNHRNSKCYHLFRLAPGHIHFFSVNSNAFRFNICAT